MADTTCVLLWILHLKFDYVEDKPGLQKHPTFKPSHPCCSFLKKQLCQPFSAAFLLTLPLSVHFLCSFWPLRSLQSFIFCSHLFPLWLVESIHSPTVWLSSTCALPSTYPICTPPPIWIPPSSSIPSSLHALVLGPVRTQLVVFVGVWSSFIFYISWNC